MTAFYGAFYGYKNNAVIFISEYPFMKLTVTFVSVDRKKDYLVKTFDDRSMLVIYFEYYQ